MAISKISGRQQPILAYVDIAYSDLLNNSGVALDAVQLPKGAVIEAIRVDVSTAFNSATSDVISVGDSGSATRYLSAGNIHATGTLNGTRTGYQYTQQSAVQVTWTGVSTAPTAGQLRLIISYFVVGREQFSQG